MHIPGSKSVVIAQTHLRIECAPDWVELALERLPHNPAEEVTLEELDWLIGGMRRAGCKFCYTFIFTGVYQMLKELPSRDIRSCQDPPS